MAAVILWEEQRGGGPPPPFTTCQSAPDAAGMLGILLPKGGRGIQCLPVAFPFLLSGDSEGTTMHLSLGTWSTLPRDLEMGGPKAPRYLTSDSGRVQLDQWGIHILLWSNAWDTQASAGVLVILTVVKLKGLSKVVLLLWGGAKASSRTQWISWKKEGVRRAAGSLGLAKGEMAGSG